MTWWLIIIIIILAIIVILFLTKLTVTITFFHLNQNEDLKITVRIWFGLISYTYHVPVMKENEASIGLTYKEETGKKERKAEMTPEKMMERIKMMQKIIEHVAGFYSITKRFLSHIRVQKFEWKSEIGTGDAAHTGILAGVVWGIKGSIITVMSEFMKFQVKPNMFIQPSFQKAVFETHFQCIFSFRVGHAIVAGLTLLTHWRMKRSSTIHQVTAKSQV